MCCGIKENYKKLVYTPYFLGIYCITMQSFYVRCLTYQSECYANSAC